MTIYLGGIMYIVSIWNGQNCFRKWISDIQNGRSIWNGQKCDRTWISDIQYGRRRPFCKNVQKNKIPYRFKMARNAIESEFRTSKMGDGGHFVKNSKKIKIPYWSKMARNAIESEFRTSKVGAGGHFVKMFWKKVCIDLKWPEMPFRKWFWTSKVAAGSHFVKKITKIQIMVLIWYGRKWFLDIQNGYRRPFKENEHLQKSWASDLNNVQTDCWPNTTWYKFTFDQYIHVYRQLCWERGNIHCVRPLGRIHTILVQCVIVHQ